MRNGVLLTAEEYYNSLPSDRKKKKDNPVMPEIPDLFMISGFEHPALPVINENGIELKQWGLIPNNGMVKDRAAADEFRKLTLNAKGETIFEKPSYRDNILSHRCLLPVSGFYEWREYENRKYPYYIQPNQANGFLLGSVYDSWTDTVTGENRNTFSIVTTPANPLMEMIHNVKKRMPLILTIEDAHTWMKPGLSQKEIKTLIKPFDENRMKAHTISRKASNAKEFRNYPEIQYQVEYPELTQQSLF
jgi:putative SOS response-associated peptidase YedK